MEFDFETGIILGKGSFGIVKKCISNFDNIHYAIKWIE